MLYVLATPIGNLDDLSTRAAELLRAVPLIIAENPSYSRRLLEHLGVTQKPRFIQFAEHNEQAALPIAIAALKQNDAVLISDAGTPGISDPGFRVVREAICQGIAVVPIPGPNAAVAALSASGLPTDKFVFLGFVPKTEIKFTKEISKALELNATVIFYESPHRILKTLAYVEKQWPQANVVVARELTKMHEEILRGTAEEITASLQNKPEVKNGSGVKGELVVLLNNNT